MLSQKIDFDISCKLSSFHGDNLHKMKQKFNRLFSGKNKVVVSPAEYAQRVVNVNEVFISWPRSSKLTRSLVNISLKLWSLNMAYMLISLLKKKMWVAFAFANYKSYSYLFSKKTCELDIILTSTVKILTINKLVKLTMFWTIGPWYLLKTKKKATSSIWVALVFSVVMDRSHHWMGNQNQELLWRQWVKTVVPCIKKKVKQNRMVITELEAYRYIYNRIISLHFRA